MVHKYQGPFLYNDEVISSWNSNAIGVYYCGYLNSREVLITLYVGKGAGEGGIRNRLLEHLRNEYWPDVTHFGYCVCDTKEDANNFEAVEIARLKPKYNVQGK
ncbi:MAG: hypothetical protein G01um101431_608 [Parcubacteria group bacterium Gr01-1014_31]|nr:MAG: hypothetical protein G01um101431_608 [Parcubacteria group bacterium Gr01-1014_31]